MGIFDLFHGRNFRESGTFDKFRGIYFRELGVNLRKFLLAKTSSLKVIQLKGEHLLRHMQKRTLISKKEQDLKLARRKSKIYNNVQNVLRLDD